jgi:ABC-type phosphate transport system substrate-binding protein
MQYLVSVIDDTAGLATPDEMAAIDTFNDRLKAEGHWVFAGGLAFTVVVNKATGLYTLTADQVQGIYSGRYNNWNQIGGSNLPISIVSRGAGFGTRAAFEKNVLKASELGRSSSDCKGRDLMPDLPVIRCEFDTTSVLLDRVDKIDGAIGYSDIAATVKHANVNRVKLDGREPDIEPVIRADYPFWTVEYFYTYGEPGSDGLLRSLLAYMNSDTAKNILRRSNYVPCVDGPQDLKGSLCR